MSKGPDFGVSAKLEIKTEVPTDASGRFVHAVLDVVSPLSEWLGMQGDKVRIHRMQVVNRLLLEAQKKLELEQDRAEPIPMKVAVPLLEHASQEELGDDFMIERWANLLASATRRLVDWLQFSEDVPKMGMALEFDYCGLTPLGDHFLNAVCRSA